jgi:L-fuconolactonase
MPSTVEPHARPSVVDAHVHFWDPGLLDYPWLRDEPSLFRRFGPDDLRADGVDVDGFVFVQAECRADQAAAEVAWVHRLADAGTPVVGIVARAALEAGRGCEAELASYEKDPLVVGVRRLIQDEPPGFAVDPGFVEATRMLPDHALSLDLCVRHHQLEEAARLVERCPGVTFVLDHLGKPPVGRDVERWSRDLSRLADFPDVHCKLSGLATEAGPGDRTATALLPVLATAVEAFGPHRCLFGSDWPVSSTAVGYREWFDLVLGACDSTGADPVDVLSRTAASVYGLATQEG